MFETELIEERRGHTDVGQRIGDVHSMWNHVARANLRVCTNPLHRYHRVPEVKEFPPDYRCWDAAAAMLAATITFFDEKTAIKVEVEFAAVALDRALEDYARRRQAEPPEPDANPGAASDPGSPTDDPES